jgi:hypothetical protein
MHIKALYEMVSVDIAKQSSAMMWNIMDWTLWMGRPPLKRLKSKSHTSHKKGRKCGSSGHRWERENWKTFGWLQFIWMYRHVCSEPLRMSALKEEAVGVVGEWSPHWDNRATRRCHKLETLKRTGGDALLVYSEQTAVRREQCDGFPQGITVTSDNSVGARQPSDCTAVWDQFIWQVLIARCWVMMTYCDMQQ